MASTTKAAPPKTPSTLAGAKNGTTTQKAAAKPMAPARHAERTLVNVLKTFEGVQSKVSTWGLALNASDANFAKTFAAARSAIALAISSVKAIPDTFVPPKKPNKKDVSVGQLVDLTDKAAKSFGKLFVPSDLKGLRVLSTDGPRAACKTPSGRELVVTRGQLVPAKQAPAEPTDNVKEA